jgi:hypothetical protein
MFSSFSLSKTIHYKIDSKTITGQRIIKQEIEYRSQLRKTIVQEIEQNREDINRLNEAVSILIEKEMRRSKKNQNK